MTAGVSSIYYPKRVLMEINPGTILQFNVYTVYMQFRRLCTRAVLPLLIGVQRFILSGLDQAVMQVSTIAWIDNRQVFCTGL